MAKLKKFQLFLKKIAKNDPTISKKHWLYK